MSAVNDVHQEITRRAAEIANNSSDKHPRFFFLPLAVASEKTTKGIDGLCLEWDREGRLYGLSLNDQQWVVGLMNGIAQEAIKQALVEMGPEFLTLIIDEAKQGRNYFDYFNNDETMDTIV